MPRIKRWGTVPEPPRTSVPEIFDSWVYSRLSVENSRSEDSIETQIAYCKDYINARNDLAYRGSFDDIGFTGTNFKRPRFNEMMADILSGEIRCVVVKDLSRLGRTYIEVSELLFDTFLQLGVRFISVNDDYDSFAPDAGRKKLLILIKNLKNSQYSKDIAAKVKSTVAMKQKNGQLTGGGVTPYGYKLTEDKQGYKIVPEAAEVVKFIFEQYNSGAGLTKICNILNTEGRPTPRLHYLLLGLIKESRKTKCHTWMQNTLTSIIDNEVYAGSLVQNKNEKRADGRSVRLPKEKWIIHHNHHDAIISRELFDAVQIQRDARRNKVKRTGISWANNIFKGKVYCSRCGRAVMYDSHINKKNKRKIYPTYWCRSCLPELKRENNIVGVSKALRFSDLETVVHKAITSQIEACLEIDALLQKISKSAPIADKRRALDTERKRLITASDKATDLLTTAYTHLLSGLLDENEFNTVREKFESDKQNAQAQLIRVDEQIARYDIDNARESECLKVFRKYKGFEQLTKEIVDALVKRIEITPLTNEVSITLNFKDSVTHLHGLIEESGVGNDVG